MKSPFENSTVRPPPPLICEHANLPAFESRKEMEKFRCKIGGEHPNPVLAIWRCRYCGFWHFWSTAPTDSNGGYKAGADRIPARIKTLITEAVHDQEG